MKNKKYTINRRSFIRFSSLGFGSILLPQLGYPGNSEGNFLKRKDNAKTISEPARKVDVVGKADVIVCGGGPSGIMAALASATKGASTILIEKYSFLGGMATAGMVGPMSKFKLNGEWIVGGLPREFIIDLKNHNGAIIDLPSGNIPFDPEIYKFRAMEILLDAGVKLILHSKVVSVVEDEAGTISHVVIESPSGRQAIQGKYFVDCTGSGEVICRSSLPWKIRSEEDKLQPMSLQFRLGGVDTDSLKVLMAHDGVKYRNSDLRTLLEAEKSKGNISNFGGPWAVWGSTIREGEVSVNATRYGGNATDTFVATEAEIQMRRDMMEIVKIFREKSPHFKNSYLIDSATQSGIRETRAAIGEYELKPEDVLNPVDFYDTIAKGGHPVDIHLPGDSGQDVRFVKEAYNIPYRCIIPKGSNNVLVGGGTISASKEAFATTRVQGQCMAIGQAAGIAAALCNNQKITVRELDGSVLMKAIQAHGGIV